MKRFLFIRDSYRTQRSLFGPVPLRWIFTAIWLVGICGKKSLPGGPSFAVTSETEQVITLAAAIRDNKQLRSVIRAADPKLREKVYEELAPHLPFTPKPYLLLK